MQYLALSVLLSASVWSLTLLLSTFIRAASGTGPILTLVYAHPYQLLLVAAILALIAAVLVFANSRRYLLTLCTIPPVLAAELLLLYQCLDMNGWYLSHFPYFKLKGGEPLDLILFTVYFILKAGVLSGIGLFPALHSLDYGIRGMRVRRRRTGFPTDALLISLGACAVLAGLALLSNHTGFGMHYLPEGYLNPLF